MEELPRGEAHEHGSLSAVHFLIVAPLWVAAIPPMRARCQSRRAGGAITVLRPYYVNQSQQRPTLKRDIGWLCFTQS